MQQRSGAAVNNNPDLNTWFWCDLIGQQLGAPYTEPADDRSWAWDTLGAVAAVLSLLQDFVHISLASETS